MHLSLLHGAMLKLLSASPSTRDLCSAETAFVVPQTSNEALLRVSLWTLASTTELREGSLKQRQLLGVGFSSQP